MNRAPRTCGTIAKDLTSVWSESYKQRRKRTNLRNYSTNMVDISSNLAKVINLHTHKTQWTPNRTNPKKSTPRCIITQPRKTKDRDIPSMQWHRNADSPVEGKPTQMTTGFSSGIVIAGAMWHVFPVLKGRIFNSEFYSWWNYPSRMKGK